MKKCYCCGRKNIPDGAAFCPFCGKPMEAIKEEPPDETETDQTTAEVTEPETAETTPEAAESLDAGGQESAANIF